MRGVRDGVEIDLHRQFCMQKHFPELETNMRQIHIRHLSCDFPLVCMH